MAKSLSLQLIASYSDSDTGINIPKSWSQTFVVTANTPLANVQNIGTTDETLALGDITPPALFLFRNLSASTNPSNSIIIGNDGASYAAKARGLLGFGVFEWNGSAVIHAKATPGAADLEYLVLPI